MAEFSFLHPHDDDDIIEALDSVPFDTNPNSNPTTGDDSITAVGGENQVNYVTLDLFPHHGVDQSDVPVELDLLAGFDGGGNFGFRVPVGSGSEEDENEFVGMDLDTHDNSIYNNSNANDNDYNDDRRTLQQFLDSLQLEHQSDAVEVSELDEDFDVLSVRYNLELERSFSEFFDALLLDDFAIFEQSAENEISEMPPASKTAVENLESVVLTEEDVENDNALCAVCVDGMPVGEKAKQLPCSHRYHGDCIVRWLGIRNTCPVCRYELPTDDPDYAGKS